MFWGVTCQLTEAGEDAAQHVAATVFRGIQVLARCSDAQLQATWREAAALAALRFDWRDQSEPLSAAQAAAYALHYYPPDQVRVCVCSVCVCALDVPLAVVPSCPTPRHSCRTCCRCR
jgi:secreted Zn-dependent insulinase-like peptidase